MTDHVLPYQCDYCNTRHKYPISAALCCDVVSGELSDDDPDIIQSIN